MRLLPLLFLSSAAIGTASAAAAPRPEVAKLRSALHSMVFPGQAARPVDPDRGDDNASLRAVLIVCNHDNPSAQRSAICPAPISPS
jgi:hypothetical protein